MFTVPIGEWFRDRSLSVAARPADRQRHGPAPVRTAVVDAMVQAHREGRENRTRELRALAALALWAQQAQAQA